jgi:hypothetical protein
MYLCSLLCKEPLSNKNKKKQKNKRAYPASEALSSCGAVAVVEDAEQGAAARDEAIVVGHDDGGLELLENGGLAGGAVLPLGLAHEDVSAQGEAGDEVAAVLASVACVVGAAEFTNAVVAHSAVEAALLVAPGRGAVDARVASFAFTRPVSCTNAVAAALLPFFFLPRAAPPAAVFPVESQETPALPLDALPVPMTVLVALPRSRQERVITKLMVHRTLQVPCVIRPPVSNLRIQQKLLQNSSNKSNEHVPLKPGNSIGPPSLGHVFHTLSTAI